MTKGQDGRWILYPENLSSEQIEFLQGRDLAKTPRLITNENVTQFGLPVGSQLTFLSEGWWGYVLKNSLGELVTVADVDESGIKQRDILKYEVLPSIDTTPEQCPNCVLPLASIATVATVGSDGEVIRTGGEVNLAVEIAKLNGPIAPDRKVTPGKVIRVDRQYQWDAESAAYYEAHPDEVPYEEVARFYASDEQGIRPVTVFVWWRFNEKGDVEGPPAYVTNVYRSIDMHWNLPPIAVSAMPRGHYSGSVYQNAYENGKMVYTDKVNPLLVLLSDAGLNAALDLWQETGNMPSSTADGIPLVTVGGNVNK